MSVRRAALAVAALAAATAAEAQSPAEFLPGDPRAGLPAAVPPEPSAPTPAPQPAAPGEGPSFVLRGVTVVGATAIPPAELAPVWADLIGRPASLATLDGLAEAIAAAYRSRGFVLSQAAVPPQTVEDGVATIRVIEGFVDRVAVAGGADNQRASAARRFAAVPEDRPLRIETLERAVLLSRDVFGGGVETVVEPSPETFGAADLAVAITPAPPSGFGSIDNRGSRLYGAWSFATGVTAYNLLGLNEQLNLLGAGAVDGSLGYIQGSAALPIAALDGTALDGAMLELEADYANGEPDLSESGAPDAQTLTTHEVNLRIGLSVPFIRTRAQNLYGTLALDWQDSDNVTGFGTDEVTESDRLLVLEAGVSWDRADRSGGVTLVEATLRQGLDASDTFVGGGVTAGVPDFTLIAAEAKRLQRLGQDGWALWLEAIGQYALDILPNSERFSLGDATIGRGYAPGDVTGDSGYGGRAELRRRVEGASFGGFAEAAELYAYGDYGRAYDRDGERDGERWQTLASAGIGVRLDVRDWLTVTPEIARQLEGRPTDTTDPNLETRFYIGVMARF